MSRGTRTVPPFRNPSHAHTKVLYGAVVLFLRDRWPVVSLEALLRRDCTMLDRPELVPTDFKMVKKVRCARAIAS